MNAFISKYSARLAGVVVGVVGGALVSWGVEVSPEALAGLQNFITEITVGAGMLGYSFVHQLIEHRGGQKNG